MATLIEIEKYFETYNFIGEDIQLDQCSKITDLKTFVKSHISILKKNSGNKLYMPYYDRLKKIYLLTKI
jgi:hypothetical protein